MRHYSLGCLIILAAACSSIAVAESPLFLTDAEHLGESTPVSAEYAATSDSNEEMNSSGLEERVLRLEAELQQLRGQQYSDPMQSLEHRLQQQDVGTGGLFGSIEVTFLKPHVTGAQVAYGLGNVGRLIDSDFQPGVRYELGYKGDSGIGVRGRYWSYDHNFAYVPTFAPAYFGIRMDAADAEITLDQRLRHWDLQVSGGLRYGRLEYSNAVATIFGVGTATFEGVGPTASLNGRRAIGNTGLSFFGNVRGSVLVGDVRNSALLTFMPVVKLEDEVMTIAENQLGIAWTKSLTPEMILEVKTAWETQYWMNSSLSDDVYGVGSNLGFMGPTIAVELRY